MYARVYVTGGRSKQRIVLSLWLLFSVFRFCLFLNKRAFFSQFDHNQKILITIRKFWLWSENSLNKRFFLNLITIRKFWSQSENSDCDQKIHSISVFFSILQKYAKLRKKTLIEWIFWSQSEFSDCDQKIMIYIFWDNNQKILITIRKFWW